MGFLFVEGRRRRAMIRDLESEYGVSERMTL
jgi:hypothetical protein